MTSTGRHSSSGTQSPWYAGPKNTALASSSIVARVRPRAAGSSANATTLPRPVLLHHHVRLARQLLARSREHQPAWTRFSGPAKTPTLTPLSSLSGVKILREYTSTSTAPPGNPAREKAFGVKVHPQDRARHQWRVLLRRPDRALVVERAPCRRRRLGLRLTLALFGRGLRTQTLLELGVEQPDLLLGKETPPRPPPRPAPPPRSPRKSRRLTPSSPRTAAYEPALSQESGRMITSKCERSARTRVEVRTTLTGYPR